MKAINPDDFCFESGAPKIKVDEETGCWIWLGSRLRGYGRMYVKGRGTLQAHKAIWEMAHETTLDSQHLGHDCGRRSCVNFNHTRPTSREENDFERYQIPRLGATTLAEIKEEIAMGDVPFSDLQNIYGVSIWYLRQLAGKDSKRNQLSLDIIEAPF